MADPVTAQTEHLRTADGRRIAYCDNGDPAAAPIISHHGTPGSRFDRHPDQNAMLAELGLRMITYDRPGYGESDPQPGRRVVDAAADVAALVDHLGIERFAVVGTSGGGPHALACSARLGSRITRVGVVVGVGPSDDPEFDFLQGMDQLNLDEFAAARDSEERLVAFLQPFVDMVHSDPDALIDEIVSHLPPSDQEVARRPAQRAVARESLIESVRQGSQGWAADDRAFATAWGFPLSEAACETRLWQGDLDVLVPRAHCAYQAEQLPNAHFELIPGAGHALADHWRDILAWLGDR
ncbi:MAG TPA: alpha/beta hydrolase [Gaiellales bacterium]|jgi:pimeloyl-ACP methyl ester carboxylesterase|nr:alpha/beta hydrolase [Gaiellales bacterium]